MIRHERQVARLYAHTFRYFWLPCPLCGENFGGHEWGDVDGMPSTIPTGFGRGTGICPDCTRAGFGYPYEVSWEWFPGEWWQDDSQHLAPRSMSPRHAKPRKIRHWRQGPA